MFILYFYFRLPGGQLAGRQPYLATCHMLYLVLCEYLKFRIESNSYFSIRFYSKRAQLFEIFEYLLSLISYLFDYLTTRG